MSEFLSTTLQFETAPLYAYPSVSSTQEIAHQLADDGAVDGTLVVADAQTAGHGRAERGWQTPAASGVAASWVMRPPANFTAQQLGLFGMLGAWAVWQSCRGLGVPAMLKWPNDVWVTDKKLAGVLPAARLDGARLEWVLLGIGVNLNGAVQLLGLPNTAITLQTVLGEPVDRWQFLRQLRHHLAVGYRDWCNQPAAPLWLADWRRHLLWRDQQVCVMQGEQCLVSGLLDGLAPSGALLLRDAAGRVNDVAFGDLSLRPQ